MLTVENTRSKQAGALAFAALLVAMSGPVAAQGERNLASDMMARIRALAPKAAIKIIDPLTLRTWDGTPDEGQINLDRLKVFCEQNDAASCKDQKDRFARGVASSLTDNAVTITPERLRVIVRARDYAEAASKALDPGNAKPLVMAPFAAGVSLVLAADFPDTTRLVNEGDLKDLGLSREQAVSLGTRQVLAAMPAPPDAEALAGSIVMIPGEDYGASYLLAADHWRALAAEVKDILWVAVPSDDRVIFGVAGSADELADLRAVVADDYAKAARGVSPLLYRWVDDGWQPLP